MYRFLMVVLCLTLLNTNADGQARKYILYEHFTQASCPPCASLNPIFNRLYLQNESKVNHIAYHTSWPGRDPMYSENSTDNDAITNYYGVNGVPNMIEDGTNIGSPSQVSQSTINNATDSPVRITISEEATSSIRRSVHVEVALEGDLDLSKSYGLRMAIVERNVNYSSAPGSNGEREFPNVFRDFIGTVTGRTISFTEENRTVSFTSSYILSSRWDKDEIYVVAYMFDKQTKKVINSGSSRTPLVVYTDLSDQAVVQGFSTEETRFNGSLYAAKDANISINIEEFTPIGWTSSFMIDGNLIGNNEEIMLTAGSHDYTLIATPNDKSAVGEYKIHLSTNSGDPVEVAHYWVVNDVTDLVIYNTDEENDILSDYYMGLMLAGSDKLGAIPSSIITADVLEASLGSVDNIYYSVGWVFPAISNELVIAFREFLSNGGNLMIAGQDFGWDINDTESGAANGNAFQRHFYRTVLHAKYNSDGSNEQDEFSMDEEDMYFSMINDSDIAAVYGSDNLYPDNIEPNDDLGNTILRYNDGASGGIRVETDKNKIVYLGIGMEMISDQEVSDAIMDATHAYFNRDISSVEFDRIFAGLNSKIYPNPVNNLLKIEFNSSIEDQLTIKIVDNLGLTVHKNPIDIGSTKLEIDVSNFPAGLYHYYLTDGRVNSGIKKFAKQ